jgi:hypothetical protein
MLKYLLVFCIEVIMVNALSTIHLTTVNPPRGDHLKQSVWRYRQIKKLEKEINTAIKNINSLSPQHDLQTFKKIENNIRSSIETAKQQLSSLKHDINFTKIEEKVNDKLIKIEEALKKSPLPIQEKIQPTFKSQVTGEFIRISTQAVLIQTEDDTEFGEQNCGYHSLKNALCLLQDETGNSAIKSLVNDKDLFQAFYNTYCVPLLPSGKDKDASVAVIREILSNFKADKSPPEKLTGIHDSLLKSQTPICCLNISVATKTLSSAGGPDGLIDVERFVQFANKPGPSSFITLAADNDVSGHWYTVVLEKDKGGNLSCTVLDSLSQIPTKQVGSIADVFIKASQNSHALLDKSYSDLGEEIERLANLISENGETADPFHFLNKKPNSLQAVAGISDGSNLQYIKMRVWQSYDFMQRHQWFKSTDPIKQMQVHNLDKLIRYYAEALTGEDKKSFQKATLNIYKQRAGGFKNLTEQQLRIRSEQARRKTASLSPRTPHLFSGEISSSTFDQFLKDLMDSESLLKPSAGKDALTGDYGQMRLTLGQCKEMFDLLKLMESPYLHDSEKIAHIKLFTSLNGEEEGSFAFDSTESARAKMASIIKTVLEGYKQAKAKNDLPAFFSCVNSGCLEGRMRDIISYTAKIDGLDLASVRDSDKYLDLFGTTLADIFSAEIFNDSEARALIFKGTFKENTNGMLIFEGSIDINELRSFLAKQPIENLVERMRLRQESKGSKEFLEFLELEKIYDKTQELDWPALLQAYINSPAFSKGCDKALEIANGGLFF